MTKLSKELQELISNSAVVIQSTLNQAINFIPIKYLGFKTIVNVTISDNPKNVEWDNNLKPEIGSFSKNVEIKQSEISNIDDLAVALHNTIKEFDTIFWNISGGQRLILLAIQKVISATNTKKHFYLYIEGNNGIIPIYDNHFERYAEISYDLRNISFDFFLPKALQLMGFDTKDLDKTRKKEEIFTDAIEKDFFKQVTEKYLKEIDFRKELIASKGEKIKFENALSSIYKGAFDYKNYHGDSPQKFGYLLEDMATYLIYDNKEVWNKILDIRTSLKLYQTDNKSEIIDEFDILVLNKFGQVINFECKSGGMTGDVAKSTNYSTYAISGVYGKPILITPLLEKDIKNENYYDENIKSAIKAAKRAGLECWGIDKIADNLEKYV